MASPARGAVSDGIGGDLGPAAIKGGVLVFVALVLGTFLLFRGTDSDLGLATAPDAGGAGAPVAPSDEPDNGDTGDNGDEVPGEGGPDDTTPDTTPDDTEPTTDTRSPGEVTVLVANGSGIPGVAASLGSQLEADGYLIAAPDNAKVPVSTSTVYYIADFEAEAAALATTLGLDASADGVVEEMPSPLPIVQENLGAANLLLVAGPDIAPAA